MADRWRKIENFLSQQLLRVTDNNRSENFQTNEESAPGNDVN